jgi:hypothetical protein
MRWPVVSSRRHPLHWQSQQPGSREPRSRGGDAQRVRLRRRARGLPRLALPSAARRELPSPRAEGRSNVLRRLYRFRSDSTRLRAFDAGCPLRQRQGGPRARSRPALGWITITRSYSFPLRTGCPSCRPASSGKRTSASSSSRACWKAMSGLRGRVLRPSQPNP